MAFSKSMFSSKDMKRIDRTKALMMDLEKAASAAVKEAAIMLKVIAREMVSRKYVKTTKQEKRDSGKRHWNAEQVAAEKARGRKHFLGLADTGKRAARRAASYQKRLNAAMAKARS